MRWYRKTMAAVAEPKLVAFHQLGAVTDYKALRYGLASCLLDDGYFAFTDKTKGYSGVAWFDEYDAKLGQAVQAAGDRGVAEGRLSSRLRERHRARQSEGQRPGRSHARRGLPASHRQAGPGREQRRS